MEELNYIRIAMAIKYIRDNFKSQPSLDEIASSVHLSPFHFQRLFTDWAGTSPKQFLQYTTIEYAKSMLRGKQATLFDTTMETGLSGTSRLHDLFVKIEGMTPAEYRDGGKNLAITYAIKESPFGIILIATTQKGICHISFLEDEKLAEKELQHKFMKADLVAQNLPLFDDILHIFTGAKHNLREVTLHLRGSEFQLKVWEALLKIPYAKLSTYGNVAQKIGNPDASRAVGTAIGTNPVAYLIPCHRVIRQSGHLGGYMWGETRKTAIIGWEAAHCVI